MSKRLGTYLLPAVLLLAALLPGRVCAQLDARSLMRAQQRGENTNLYGVPNPAPEDEEGQAQQPVDSTKEKRIKKPLESYFFSDSIRALPNFKWNVSQDYNRVRIEPLDTTLTAWRIDYPFYRNGVGDAPIGALGQGSVPLNYFERPQWQDFSFASRVGAPGMVVVGVMLADLLAGHALPFAEAAFAQTRVEFHVQPHEVGEGVRGLLRAEQIRRDDEHAAGRGGRVVDFVDVGQMGVAVCGLRELVVMFGEMRDFRPIVGFGEFVRALVRLPPSDDVEGNVDLSLQPSDEIVCGASVAQEQYCVDHGSRFLGFRIRSADCPEAAGKR